MIIDKEKARKILQEEVHEAKNFEVEGIWVERIKKLSDLCTKTNKTMIAALGTGLLAKATDLSVDVLSLEVGSGDTSRTYSARNLCKEVLSADANKLGIDLGVTGREPLNNSPFYKQVRISRDLKVRKNSFNTLDCLVSLLEEVNKIKSEKQARKALRSFLSVRERSKIKKKKKLNLELDVDIYQKDLARLATSFIYSFSEGGKAAQAVVAGLLDTLFGPSQVEVTRINDPSIKIPGDVTVINKGDGEIHSVYEVRDKPVTEQDVHNFVEKVRKNKISKAGIVGVSPSQEGLNQSSLYVWAEDRDISLAIFIGLDELVQDSMFWSIFEAPNPGRAFNYIFKRLEQLEMSEEALAHWCTIAN